MFRKPNFLFPTNPTKTPPDNNGAIPINASLIMSDFVRASYLDLDEAYQCGIEAIKIANNEESGFMVAINRISNVPYKVSFGKALLSDVAVKAKPMPFDFFNSRGNFVSEAFYDYIRPLIGDLPEFVELEKKFV